MKALKIAPVLAMVGAMWPRAILAASEWCAGAGPDTANPQINSALGCLPVQPAGMVQTLIPYFFGITGGISLLLMIYGFILMATSGGDPKAVAGAQETVTSALKGLLLSVFGIFIVRFLLLDVLKIPGITK